MTWRAILARPCLECALLGIEAVHVVALVARPGSIHIRMVTVKSPDMMPLRPGIIHVYMAKSPNTIPHSMGVVPTVR
jgi:hypothetical protein